MLAHRDRMDNAKSAQPAFQAVGGSARIEISDFDKAVDSG